MRVLILMLGLLLSVQACRTTVSSLTDNQDLMRNRLKEPKICAAMRGNGPRMPALFGGLAQIIDQHGLVDRVAGGSSASIVSFFYESMVMNPAVWQCGSAPCSDDETRDRVALLLKSISGIGPSASKFPASLLLTLFKDVSDKFGSDLGLIKDFDERAVRDRILSLLENLGNIKDLANPELKSFLSGEAPLSYRIAQVKATAQDLGKFQAKDEVIFFRPGLFNFKIVAQLVGKMASFYAGYAPAKAQAWDDFLMRCAPGSRGKLWNALPKSCHDQFTRLLLDYYKSPTGKNRINDQIGAVVGTFISTAVVVDPDTVARIRSSQAGYLNNKAQPLGRVFVQVRIGYWGASEDLARAEAKARIAPLKDNPHWQKFLALDAAPWEQAIVTSPAEPGLASAQTFVNGTTDMISLGGWGNLFPSQILKEGAACEDVFYITRIGDTAFDSDVTRILGITDEEAKSLYDMRDPNSSVRQSIAASDHVICTDWDSLPLKGDEAVEGLIREGYTKMAVDRKAPSNQLGCY